MIKVSKKNRGGECKNSSSFSDRGQKLSCIDFNHESQLMVISFVVPHRDLEIISSPDP